MDEYGKDTISWTKRGAHTRVQRPEMVRFGGETAKVDMVALSGIIKLISHLCV